MLLDQACQFSLKIEKLPFDCGILVGLVAVGGIPDHKHHCVLTPLEACHLDGLDQALVDDFLRLLAKPSDASSHVLADALYYPLLGGVCGCCIHAGPVERLERLHHVGHIARLFLVAVPRDGDSHVHLTRPEVEILVDEVRHTLEEFLHARGLVDREHDRDSGPLVRGCLLGLNGLVVHWPTGHGSEPNQPVLAREGEGERGIGQAGRKPIAGVLLVFQFDERRNRILS